MSAPYQGVNGDGRGIARLNEAFLTLLPKGAGARAVDIREFRPA